MSKPVITVENLSKSYLLRHQQTEGGYMALRDVITDKAKSLFKPKKNNSTTKELFWALKDVSFEVNQGDRIGIIGRNGAGKSTLLKILSRIVSPTKGKITMEGRVASLLEVGTGFHPELTGRENIFLNGAILGMNKAEIKSKFDEIVDFSGVEKFIDTPVKRFSSGMYVRLAFAVAAHLDTEILIIDEVLAVGDAEFQKKCLGKMEDVSAEGRTIIFVSHNMAAVQSLCNRGLLLDNGVAERTGSTNEVVQYYINIGMINKVKPPIEKYRNYKINEAPVFIKDIFIKGSQNEIPIIPMNQAPIIVIHIIAKQKIENANISLAFYNAEGVKTDMAFSWDDKFYLNVDEGTHEIEFSQNHFSLSPGRYTLGVGINQSFNSNAWDGIVHYPIFEIENNNNVVHWDFRPWAVHHSQNNKWEIKLK